MVEDAKFEDAGDQPLHLKAMDGDDLQVISSLTQDAVFPTTEMNWDRRQRQFAILLNRFRWEDAPDAASRGRAYERVQSVLLIADVQNVASQGIDVSDADTVLSLLSMNFVPGADGTGRLELVLAGDGAIALDVEVLDVTLKDVTRPYLAPSKSIPDHP